LFSVFCLVTANEQPKKSAAQAGRECDKDIDHAASALGQKADSEHPRVAGVIMDFPSRLDGEIVSLSSGDAALHNGQLVLLEVLAHETVRSVP